ncbi:MucR family transcriptional regulator [Sphingobium sp. CAP-1]|uniref:MucR family transcriptional regulator n=1 Tax=Sphingobium sp. CAP-1 TaxID=2676077 RepID=UPI0012BB21F5|nr:MucR family transcriptional regulator [Sphingobium sp. CAP-1]QGP81176.1 transcriptional regulator [Sphingobium sp. CAP-1]
MAENNQTDITALTVQLLSAYVSRNEVPIENFADLIKTTRAALVESPAPATEEPAAPTFTPAVSVRKSLSSPEHILSLIDGKPYKTLKRHLASHGLTPEQYRERYKLPKDYPLVAASYSEARRAVAEKLGLGKKPTRTAKTAESSKNATGATTADVAKAPKAAIKATATASKKTAAKPKTAPLAVNADAAALETKDKAAKAPAGKRAPRKQLSIAIKSEETGADISKATIAPATPAKRPGRKPASSSAPKPKAPKAARNGASARLDGEKNSEPA